MKVSNYAQLGQYRRKFLRYNRLLCATAILALASPVANAADTIFNGDIDADWSNAANWSNGVPSGSDRPIIESTVISNVGVTLAGKMFVGKAQNSIATLTINNSAFTLNNDTVLADVGSSSGTINIVNASFSNIGKRVEIGNKGIGEIVLDGGSIAAKQYWLGRSTHGNGTLHVKSGTVDISAEIRVANGWESKGLLTFDNGTLTVPNMYFGYAGLSEGRLVLNGGAITVSNKLFLGRNGSSTCAIELAGGVLQINALASVANGANESIEIAGGILRLKQSNRALFDKLIANGSLYWTPSAKVAGYDPESADETIDDANGTLYIRNDDDGYFSAWSTAPNSAPVFTNDPINVDFAEIDQAYSGTIAQTATDEEGDLLAYSIISGPTWLSADDDGSLTGEPTATDVGANTFTVEVNDGNGGSATAILKIWVAGDFTELTFDDFQAGWGNWLDGGEDAQLVKMFAIERKIAKKGNKNYKQNNKNGDKHNDEAVELQGNSGTDSSTTLANTLALTDYDELKINFTFITLKLNDGDNFWLRYSSDSGESWTTIKTFVNGVDFNHGNRETLELSFNRSEVDFTDNALFRFQANTIGKLADVYIDSINISARATSFRNSAPVFTNDPIDGANATEDSAYSGTLAGTATDADSDPLTYIKVSGPDWLSIDVEGTLTGAPNTADIGDNSFSVNVSDGNGDSATAMLHITVVPAPNNAPVFTRDAIKGANGTAAVAYNGTLADSATDADADPLTFSKVTGPAWLSIAADGALAGTPTNTDFGDNAFTVEVNDGNGDSATASLNIYVAPALGAGFTRLTYDNFEADWGNWLDGGEHARIAQSNCIGDDCANIQAYGEESTITLANTLDLSDYNSLKIIFTFMPRGIDGTEGFKLEYSLDGGQNWSTLKAFVNDVDFHNDIRETLELIYTTNDIDLTNNALIRFQNYGNGTGDDIYLDEINISAGFINYLPVFVNDPINAANAARNWDYSGSVAHLVSDRNGDPLTFAKVDGPTWLSIATDGALTGTPVLSDVGANVFTVQASDGVGGITSATLNITVDLSLPPSFTVDRLSKDNAVEGTDYHASIAGDASDLDGDPLSFAKLIGPSWLNVAANGALSGTPTVENVGLNTFTFEVRDGYGGSDTATLTIYVASVLGGYPDYGKSPTADEWLLAFSDLTGPDTNADANPDGDAWDNLHEYAFGGDPTSSVEQQAVLDIQITNNTFTVSHTRLRNATSLGIYYQFQLAVNASNPAWLDVTPDDINVQLLGASYELVSYSGHLPFDIDTDTSTSIGRLVVTNSGPFADQGATRTHAELVIANYTKTQSGNIYDDRFGYAAPQGIVDNSSPWMHVRIPFPGDPDWPSERGNRLYHYKLSQDPSLTSNVITETPKRWSFFNPSAKLAKGTWYWTAGHSTVSDPENIEWLTDVYQFKINGNEEQYLPPSADAVWETAQQKALPKLLMRENDFGTLTDIQDDTSDVLIAHADKIMIDGGVANADTVARLVMAYGASGDVVYRDEALARYANVPASGDGGFAIRTWLGMGIAFLDIMGDELEPAMEADLVVKMMDAAMNKKETWLHTMLDRYEHRHYESHVVQKSIHIIMFAGLAIGDRHPLAKEMFRYTYELWLYKGPHGGRSDGSWHNGLGYFNVNEDQLTSTPWVLGEITGFDYMMHPWYRNFSKFISYVGGRGDSGQYYGDSAWDGYGTNNGGPGINIAYLHAFTHPNNRWMRWQAQDAGPPLLAQYKDKKYADEWQRWFHLPIRKNYVEPDFDNVQTPVATAAAFRDVGYVASHTNITGTATNFKVTMRSSPFSSSHKSHASQNAFTTAYGGKPLFYRTGWRKKGIMSDYTDSKAFNLIMPNEVSQKRHDKSAYAFLPRFAHGDRMSYWIGDASNAYPNATGVNRFRRHMVHLKPNILVIYDELESTEAATTWTYTLNAHDAINKTSDNVVSVHNGAALATANLFSSSPLSTTVLGPTNGHWNTRITTTEQSPAVRFLNVIELTPSTDINEVVAALPVTGTDLITVAAGDYTVIAQVDPNLPARLEIRSSDGNVALLYAEGVNSLEVDGETVLSGRYDSSTLFMEKNTPRGDIVEELVDVLPDAVTYGNKY